LGQARQGADLARLGFQGQMGDVQQQQRQDIINQQIQNFALAQEMPMQRLSGYNALLRGYATPTSTVSQYQAQPSGLQQLAGLGTAAAGIGTIAGVGKKEGGVIKYAGVELQTPMHLRVLPNEHQYHSFNSQCRAEN
jgi:hypothetical protein